MVPLWTPQGHRCPIALLASASSPTPVLRTSPLTQTWHVLATKGRFSSLVAMPKRGQGCPGHRPHSLPQEAPIPVAPGHPVADIFLFPFQAMSPSLWPPSCPLATHRPASPSPTPPPRTPQTGHQSSGPHSPPGREEDIPQDLRILSVQPLALSPSRLTSFPAAPQVQASCQHTCIQLWACNPQEDLWRARLPLSPTVCQPVGEPAAPNGCGAPSLSQSLASPSPSPSPAPTENYSCESLRAHSSSRGQTAPDSRARYTGRSYASAKC